jgi:hypothetical protein
VHVILKVMRQPGVLLQVVGLSVVGMIAGLIGVFAGPQWMGAVLFLLSLGIMVLAIRRLRSL